MATEKHDDPRPCASEYEQKVRALQARRSDSEKKQRADGRNYSLTGLRLTTVLNQLQALQAIQGMQELMPKDRAAQRRWKVSEDPKERAQLRQWLTFKADWLESLLEDTVREIEFLDAQQRECKEASAS